MNKFVLQILIVLLFSIALSAQINDLQPILVDEFGEINNEDTAARLDNFINEVSNMPNMKGIVRIYSRDEDCFLCRYREASWIDPYLKNTRKFSPEKYSFEYCDADEKGLRIQLYSLPIGAALPKCEETISSPKNTVLFDGTRFYDPDVNKLTPLEDNVIDVVGMPNGEYSRNTLIKVKEILDKSPESKIYIVVYLGTNLAQGYYDEKRGYIEKTIRNLDKKSLAKKLLQNAKDEFVKNGIKPSQIESVEGGYVDSVKRLEFYLVPKGGENPKPKPDYFPKKKQRK